MFPFGSLGETRVRAGEGEDVPDIACGGHGDVIDGARRRDLIEVTDDEFSGG